VFLMQDSSASISKDAALALVNITGDESGTKLILTISENNTSLQDDTYTLNLVEICIK